MMVFLVFLEKLNHHIINLAKNIYDITLSHKKKEIEDKKIKDMTDNILFFAFKKKLQNKNFIFLYQIRGYFKNINNFECFIKKFKRIISFMGS